MNDLVTQKQVEEALKDAIKKVRISKKATENFDKIAGKFFGIDDFSRVYTNHDELVEPIEYANGNLTWKQLCEAVEDYKSNKK